MNHAAYHPSEEELIAYQLHEVANPAAIRGHLESCAACAMLSESIAETLRVFSATPVPAPNLEHQWQRLQGSLGRLETRPRPRMHAWLPASWAWAWPVVGVAATAVALLLFAVLRPTHSRLSANDVAVIRHSGPLSATPANPEIAQQLDSAERLLTVVNHASGPLDATTRSQAHDLLLKNAVYIRDARDRGDFGTASVLEELGRVLTNLDHEEEPHNSGPHDRESRDREPHDRGWHLRLELNTDGLLLDIRILQQNDAKQ